MREILLTKLAKEVLGPRDGLHEVLTENPLGEYITGVLAPVSEAVAAEPEVEAELGEGAGGKEAEDEARDADIDAPPVFAPVLDPKSRPHSLGVSFVVKSKEREPVLDVSLTWARYREESESAWHRQPRVSVVRVTAAQVFWIDSNGKCVKSPADAEISFHVLIRPGPKSRTFLITLYLVNRVAVPKDTYVDVSYHIFQPQIRVHCEVDTKIVAGLEGRPYTDEDRLLQFLYREHPVLARGHICSAVWKSVDPERASVPATGVSANALKTPPLYWVDGELLDSRTRPVFAPPDVRTEYVPITAVQAPNFTWRTEYGPVPELRADALAETWSAAGLKAGLTTLTAGYRKWIQERENERNSGSVQPEQKIIADRLIESCNAAAGRMERGIDLLIQDEDVRLAFCFAMKAIALQSSWPSPSGDSFHWRPFQLAFLLMALESAINPRSEDRKTCDLLWVATGGGKTETYLALAVLILAHRRRRALRRTSGDRTGAGVGIISRYTLRLLTIQQFRRAVKVVTAMEYLRVAPDAKGIGWRSRACQTRGDYIWGSSRFSAGLWVGGSVTPNRLLDTWASGTIPGAINILRGVPGQGEPAQILRCPACESVLSIPSRDDNGVPAGSYSLHFVTSVIATPRIQVDRLNEGIFTVSAARFTRLTNKQFGVLSVDVSSDTRVTAEDVEDWWSKVANAIPELQLACARASRPGYFIRSYSGQQAQKKDFDFDIYCPNPDCPLHSKWAEGLPAGLLNATASQLGGQRTKGALDKLPGLRDGNRYAHVHEAFQLDTPHHADRIPIPALTVDEQIYHRCPSMVIATVDKFARPVFEPRASALFGTVDFHHCIWGYYRAGQHPSGSEDHPSPSGKGVTKNYIRVTPMDSPDLILQDELHLIEGPLGSLMGLYEAAVDYLCEEAAGYKVKYISSTATVRQAEEQVQSVFARGVCTFPPLGLSSDDRFFLRLSKPELLNDKERGQVYVGICSPGRGPLTPLIRIWSSLLQAAWNQRTDPAIDPYWTLVGYFNAIRELAGARALYRQDIPERLAFIAGAAARSLAEDRAQELSSRTRSTELPSILDILNRPGSEDALFTTSMFGTGVDIPRLGLMVVNGQPKTTSSYIQATGRVGRSSGALCVAFLRASRPRDLNHYEFFCGYHEQLHRFVEPVTVMPFAPGALERASGPVGVFILRNRRHSSIDWTDDASASQMGSIRTTSPEVLNLSDCLEQRSQAQPELRQPPQNYARRMVDAGLDHWQQVAARQPNMKYVEYTIARPATSPVVLGDPQHEHAGLDVIYDNAPQSLREIEETCGFQT
jgi:hypothetical protein